MTDRPTTRVEAPHAWIQPWQNVAELAATLSHQHWTLFGGLMVQLHMIMAGKDSLVRPTSDIDMLIHVEKPEVSARRVHDMLRKLGYTLGDPESLDGYYDYRWRRGKTDIVDVLIADHVAPVARRRAGSRPPRSVEGGTQALKRTMNVEARILPEFVTTISVPDTLGALVLKAAAAKVDPTPERHLQDVAALLACIDDPFVERERFAGSDRGRLQWVQQQLGDDISAGHWLHLPPRERRNAADVLAFLLSG